MRSTERILLLSVFFSAVAYAVLTYLILGIFAYGADDFLRGRLRNMEPSEIALLKPQMDKALSSGYSMLAQFTLQTFGVFCAIAGVLFTLSFWGLWHYFWDYLKKNTTDKGKSLGL